MWQARQSGVESESGEDARFFVSTGFRCMVKFMILFRQPADLSAFESSYNDFLALVERMPDVARRQVISVLGSPQGESPYYRILEVYFAEEGQMRAALLSRAGQEAGGQLLTFPRGSFEAIFADVYEEAGGSTETNNTHADA
jgi:uncharacterized protein (TIGR02118 family)